jgi:bifunctional NMN adenylyltransferase/nudix hydrolase
MSALRRPRYTSRMPRPAVLIGRFQPPHRAHLALMSQALAAADELVIVLGSARSARTSRNPLRGAERTELISAMLRAEGTDLARVRFERVPDVFYHLPLWVDLVQRAVKSEGALLTGFEKDASSFYLKLFPGWKALVPDIVPGVNATDIRGALFRRDWTSVGEAVTPAVLAGLQAFSQTTAFTELLVDLDAVKRLTQLGPIRTGAALIVSGEQMLLQQRRERPGLGLWSLPEAESVQEALRLVLNGEPGGPRPVHSRLLNAPQRVPGLDWETRATLFELASPLPAQTGARWLPVSRLRTHPETFFADHAQGIQALLENWPGNEN